MNFATDKQTLQDLALFPNGERRSIISLFGKTQTIGGQEILYSLFSKPLKSLDEIKGRLAVFRYLRQNNIDLKIDRNTCDFAEFYLKGQGRKQLFPILENLINGIRYWFNGSHEYYISKRGVENILSLLEKLLSVTRLPTDSLPVPFLDYKSAILAAFTENEWIWIKQLNDKTKLSTTDIARADKLFTNQKRDQLKKLLELTYHLDAYQTIHLSSSLLGFTLPIIKEVGEPELILKGLFHPFISNPIDNDVEFHTEKNVCFVTGTNMAGKSTLLKALGVAIYLSQQGFPVPATYMETSLFEGLMTTINMPDNIEQGQSHFYSEVLRVKQVAKKVNESKNVFVIFDELFRGTNVKDAYDASLAIISAFANVRTSFFVVSTHIVEVAHQLAKIGNIDFRYMETTFDKDYPVNSYKLKQGITEERVGMWLINNEKILELIAGKNQ